jgi:mono/diheme cytochrome c family protein
MSFGFRRVRSAMAGVVLIGCGVFLGAPHVAADPATSRSADPAIERGRYLVQIGGCNDCHTAGYPQSGGQIPMNEWLTGSPVGFKGGWGTSYPSNLRLTVAAITEEQWLPFARAPRRPPMPWFNLRDMSDDDLRAMYRFIRALGPKGELAPAAAAPGAPVDTPFIVFEPKSEQRVDGATTAQQVDRDR